jgi:hypothetical protein
MELFLAGLRDWDGEIRLRLVEIKSLTNRAS